MRGGNRALVLGAASAAVLYAVLWLGLVDQWSWLHSVDDRALRWCHDYAVRGRGRTGFWRAVSTVLSPTTMRIVALAGIGIALFRRRPRVAVFLALSVLLSGPLTAAAKALSDRPRPMSALVAESSTAFPSGHAVGITVAVLAFATVLWPTLSRPARVAAICVGALAVFAVGLSRVVLNVHHPSDVVAGWALGFVWYGICYRVSGVSTSS